MKGKIIYVGFEVGNWKGWDFKGGNRLIMISGKTTSTIEKVKSQNCRLSKDLQLLYQNIFHITSKIMRKIQKIDFLVFIFFFFTKNNFFSMKFAEKLPFYIETHCT